MRHFLTSLTLLIATTSLSAALQWQTSGYLAAESRYFPESPLDEKQSDTWEGSLAFELEVYAETADGRWAWLLQPFGRIDSVDSERTHFDLREFYAHWRRNEWELKAGLGKVFWGVTESRHLVDIINQTDLVENIDGEDKLGQPMIQATRLLPFGTLDLFILPGFRERTFPGIEGRLRPAFPIDQDYPIYESIHEEWHTDFALRLKAYTGPFDIGLSYFYGTSRDPFFTPIKKFGQTVLVPNYTLIHKGGLDIQYTTGAWLWKFEGIIRDGKGQSHKAATGGFEYTYFGLLNSAWDLGLLTEYHYDSRKEASPNPFNDDLFLGARLAPNDEFDTAFLAGSVIDLNNGSTSLRLEFERRIGQNYKLVIEGQYFAESDPLDPGYALRDDSFLLIELRRYF